MRNAFDPGYTDCGACTEQEVAGIENEVETGAISETDARYRIAQLTADD
ncbi:hypothetical protein VSR01_16380 [Actinacidiphila sp. DG2A-62]|nr:hypothetical protein [Actinacidiphila sp. DG2A-62]MEC3995023.1 hypothetical protein [Actinacidiphila sp. DG2A-62]